MNIYGGSEMFKHILVPTDGTPFSDKAIEMALNVAKLSGASVSIITASVPFHVLTTETLSLSDTKESYAVDAKKRGEERLKFGLERAKAHAVSADSEHVFNDHPYEAIIDMAIKKGCDLIVMASHGRRGVAGLLIGSETTKVLTHSKTPVLVCR